MTHVIFDHKALRLHRNRAANTIALHDAVLLEIADRLADRLSDMSRRFPLALELGAWHGLMHKVLAGRGGIETLVQSDISHDLLKKSKNIRSVSYPELIPFADNSVDLVLSCWGLHWVNDLPGALVQIRRILKSDGLFLAVMPGGETLRELREALTEASMAEEGGLAPRISPFIDVRDAGALMQRAGFSLPVVDTELLEVRYPDPLALMHELRGMGETNALIARPKHFTRRSTLLRAAELYMQRYPGPDGRIPATLELVTLTGWKPHASQQQPLARGSGQLSLAKTLGNEGE